MIDLGLKIETTARSRIEKSFAELKSGGYLKTLEDAEDVLNVANWRIYSKIENYRGATDAQAFAWTLRIVDNATRDVARKFLRRRSFWNDFFEKVPSRLRQFLERVDDADD